MSIKLDERTRERLFWLEVGARVAIAREIAGMTQADLGRCVGLSRASMANLEAGRQRSNLLLFARIAVVLKVSLKNLVPSVRSQ